MTKILNKIIIFLKNTLLLVSSLVAVYIVVFMYKRLGKDMFGADFLEFFGVLLPFLVLLILSAINMFTNYKNVKENLFFNITSLLTIIVICIFCYRSMYDQNMILWHKYEYNINFTYFSDQIPVIKTLLYGLSGVNILMIILGKINSPKEEIKIEKVIENNEEKIIELKEEKTKKVNKKK